jgi:hypothetical protein
VFGWQLITNKIEIYLVCFVEPFCRTGIFDNSAGGWRTNFTVCTRLSLSDYMALGLMYGEHIFYIEPRGGVSQRGEKGGCQIRRPAVWEINGYHHLVVA